MAPHYIQRLLRNYCRAKRSDTHHAQREIGWFLDDDGYWVIRGRLTSKQVALLQSVM
jgi:hypothetical protein